MQGERAWAGIVTKTLLDFYKKMFLCISTTKFSSLLEEGVEE